MRIHSGLAAAACAVLVVTLAACGSDDDSADDATSPPTTATATTAAPTTAAPTTAPASATTGATETAPPSTEAADEVATTTEPVGPADGTPIKIGFVNLEGGAVSLPELRIGVQTAAAYINEHGGADNHPLEIVPCNVDGTPEKSIDCANQLIGDGVSVVMEGYDPASDAMLPVLDSAGVALTGHAAFGPQQQVADNAFFFGTANPSFTAGFLDYYASQGATSIMLFLPDNAAFRASAESTAEPIADSLGLDATITFYDPAAANWDALATTALAEDPDVVGTVAPDGDCVGLLGALRNVQYGGDIFLGACTLFLIADPAKAVGVATTADLWKPSDIEAAPANKQEELNLYVDTMTAAGHEDLIPGFAWDYFSDTMNLARILATIDGEVTPEAITEAFMATKDFDSFMGPTISCDHTAWPGESACGNQVLLYQVQEDGSQKAITPDFIDTSTYIAVLG
jgi:branched-chain amino acid transport system substrate-binding protein